MVTKRTPTIDSGGKLLEKFLPERLGDVALKTGVATDVTNPASIIGAALNATYANKGNGESSPTLAPLFVETLTTGLVDTTPANLRTGLSATQNVTPDGGYVEEMTIAVTGTKGSAVLTTAETAKVAGLGTAPFEVSLNAADGSNDFFATVLSHNGSTQITLLHPLTADFTGTLSSKYDASLGQHLTKAATKAYAQHALAKNGVTGSRGRILEGSWSKRPIAYQAAWVKNAALTSYGVSNSAAPVVQSALTASGAVNVRGFDGLAQAPNALNGVMWCGTHTVGHGADATLYPARNDSVLEFYTSAYRAGASVLPARIRVVVTADGTTIYDQTHKSALTKVSLPVFGKDKVTVSATNNDGSIFYMFLSELTLREAGVAGSNKSPLRKIVTLGDSWFAYYGGQFAKSLADKTGATVVNHALGGMTSDWGLDWFDAYVLAEKPDECWIHFFTNDANNLTGTFTAADGTQKALWPTGLTSAQSQDRWRANLLLLAQRCRDAGIKPVIIMPGGTASQSQTTKHTEWAAGLEQPAPVSRWAASALELADATAYINTVGKATGNVARVGTSTKTAKGPLPADGWGNLAEDALLPIQKRTLSAAVYQVTTGITIGTDTDANGLSDGLSTASYSTTAGDTYTYSIVGGNQRANYVYGTTSAGNTRVGATFTPAAGKEYLIVFDVINATASAAMADSVTDLTGSALTFATLGGSTAVDASGNGVICAKATANAATAKYARIAPTRSNGNTRTFDIRRALIVDTAALYADAPNAVSMSTTELAAFVLALLP